jgi:hypothetical protein
MIKDFLFRLGITVIVSAIIGVSLHPFLGFWSAFGVGFGVQIIGNFFYNSFISSKFIIDSERLLNERVEMLTTNEIKFPCPCGSHSFQEVILLKDDNVFTCPKCNQNVRLSVTFTPTVVTTPLDNEAQLQKLSQIKPEEEIQ